MQFNWGTIQYKEDGKVLLLYRHERIFTEGLIKPYDIVLDIGGWGHLIERIIQEDAHCIVWDKFTEDQYYPDRVRQNPYRQIDICKPLIDGYENYFNTVCCFETLEHVEDQLAALKNIYTICKPGGYFVGTIPLPGFCHHEGEENITFLTQESLLELLISTGFLNIIIEPTASLNKDGVPCSLYFKAKK